MVALWVRGIWFGDYYYYYYYGWVQGRIWVMINIGPERGWYRPGQLGQLGV